MSKQNMYHYECIGCGKSYNTYKYYPDGWICLSCRPKTKITLKCSECESPFSVEWDTYRMKNPNIPWRCRKCNDKYRNALYNAKPDDEKKAFVAAQVARTKEYWANLSEDAKKKDSERRKLLWQERWKSGKAIEMIDAMKAGRSKWWNSLTDEEKKQYWNILNAGRAIWWEELSDEEKAQHMKHPHEGFTNWFNSLSVNEQKEFLKPVSDGRKKFWDNMTPEKYQDWRLSFAKGFAEYLDRIDPYSISVAPNKNESDLINILNQNNIGYIFQYPNTIIHPDFSKLFPKNPVTGADLVNPIHMWDFLIYTKESNVFVDVDGSMHFNDTYTKTHPYTGITYKELDYKKFNDSQRPYQTDGLPAYAILCHDDKLTNDTPVLNINTGSQISFKTFISDLCWMNMSEEEKKEIISLMID